MEKEISRATLKRLPTYLAYLKAMPDSSGVNISATALAAGFIWARCRCARILRSFPPAAARRSAITVPR